MINTPRQNRAFSLIEVLMSIFILGIGVIAIASLLPAGIKQQQNAKNDAYGPVVADSALATLRSRLSPLTLAVMINFVTPPHQTTCEQVS